MLKTSITNKTTRLIFILILSLLSSNSLAENKQFPQTAFSKDGTQIFYNTYGKGKQTLVFVHGWSCDSRYWKEQVPYFSKKFQVITLDLAGHGHSGSNRNNYTMPSFGEDVKAVIKKTNAQDIILIGHSMGGWVIAETANILPETIKGLIGIDSLENIEYPMKKEEYEMMVAPLKKNFQKSCREFVKSMISPDKNVELNEWILSDMSAAPKVVALSAMESFMEQYISGRASRLFEEIRLPVITVNADKWPVNFEANRNHMFSFDAIIIKDSDHFLMLNKPKRFNTELSKAINMILKNGKELTRNKKNFLIKNLKK